MVESEKSIGGNKRVTNTRDDSGKGRERSINLG